MLSLDYEDDGLAGTVVVHPLAEDSLEMELLIPARHPFETGYDLRFTFTSKERFCERLEKIRARACDSGRGRSLHPAAWPYRRFKFIRPGGRFLGTIRESENDRSLRAWTVATVLMGNRVVLEISDRTWGETSFNLPISLFIRLSEFIRKMDG